MCSIGGMNRDKAKALLPVITAFAEGKEIEVQDREGWWRPLNQSSWLEDPKFYRIKPTSSLEPFEWADEREAHKDGKKIQVRPKFGDEAWNDTDEPQWHPFLSYRVKPEPKLIPLGHEDVSPGSAIRPTIHETGWYGVVEVTHDGIYYSVHGTIRSLSFEAMTEQCHILRPNSTEWLPCSKPETTTP